jgi:poly-gamma-glutamate capsule biosynthesis protein CapA/YwtB (metallophosphatase superfamily)
VQLTVRNHEPSTDNVWRVPVSENAEVELETDGAIQRIEWIGLVPEYRRCNLAAKRAHEIGFASGAPPRPRSREIKLTGTERIISLSKKLGTVRVKARVEVDGRVRETPAIEIRRFVGDGFRAAITEQFELPYLFGSGELNDGINTGPETGFGADCANFVVYALRRQGCAVPWSNPRQLRKYLEPVAENIRVGETAIRDDDIAGGLIIHLGSHVAAVMEDRPPLGVLDRNDIVAHQLEGTPEMLSLGRLLDARKKERFDLLRVPARGTDVDLVLGGDVMLGRTVGAEIERGADPLAGIRPLFERASNRIVNLECVLSDRGKAVAGKRYCFRAPLDALQILTAARINAVSLANNHAGDFGADGLLDAIARLQANNISAICATEPLVFQTRMGPKAAVVALDDTNEENALDRDRAAAAIVKARRQASFVLVFMHWGEENVATVSERQRELAHWLIDHGADAIAGSHPHCVQPFDSYHGRPIFYSLGNLVFDGAPTLPNWNRGDLLEVNLGGIRPSFHLVPVQLDPRGFPQVADGGPSAPRSITSHARVAGK